MAHRLLKTIGAAWLGVALSACGTQGSTGDETQAPEQEKSGEDIQSTLNALGGAQVLGVHADGIPDSIRGELGRMDLKVNTLAGGRNVLAGVAPAFRLNAEDMVLRKAHTDEQGNQHLRFTQTKNGLQVIGGELVVHVRPDGTVFRANGSARDGLTVSALPRIAAQSAQAAAVGATVGTGLGAEGAPRLVYVRTEDGALRLAYEVTVTGESNLMPVRDLVYVSAVDGSIVLRAPQIHSALNRKLYSANNGTSTPGTLKRSEGQAAIGDSHVDMNYDMLGYTYNCYKTLFNRDSLNNAGQTLISTVHYSKNYVNAYWDGTQMVYGDGDGVNSIELGKDADVTVHELTHAVTENESNLTYSGQSGGLNEAMSDTFGAICESWSKDWSIAADVWMVGEDVWTPNIPNDALRYMDDPAKDGVSLDWAPNYNGQDVHYTSGIPNLAFALLSKGGKHPRGRSTIEVPAIGVEKAGRIWYKANTDLYTASTTYVQAKAWTIQAAADLGYDQATQDAVKAAWEAVGVGVTVPPPTSIPLTNGTAVTGLSDSAGNKKYYSLAVPAGATALTFTISGGTGDADLYVRFGAAPDASTYDCRPYVSGNGETCTITNIQAGTYYVMLNAYAAYSGVTLKGSFTAPGGGGGNVLQSNVPVTGISGASGSFNTEWVTLDVPANKTVSISISGGTGDADLYVRFGSSPTTSTYDCRPYSAGNSETCTLTKTTAGKYYVKLNGYSAYSGVTLKAIY
ncbi:M4 family metallopeptidase [Corallococcus sp. Z5C101001]|uniref:M4 family metallopeptidase n=1 Tax=Corallococcus sp. Z5C101001 TaxID=2596829 RepID=UPI00117F8F45|nr:M4 family metallopeptidase [Corallococcus sp. Z5C101001]TSC22809.1 peptidase M4 [Corallococcus sp. Z5C101001]